ncbi:MAG: glutamine synthetase, type [Clostridia bacterium]|nr:glutamine synthetase, type [Clostridia bacterium]
MDNTFNFNYNYTKNEVIQFIKESDVKFVRLAFCDIFGIQKNISIISDELPRAFESGIFFDASAIKGFMNVEESDLLLFPDPTTMAILPWRPQQGRVIRFFCDIKHPNGLPFEGDGRIILKKAALKAEEKGYSCKIGSECEFYLFETDEKGYPTKIPHDFAGYMDIAPADKGENVRREICLTLEEMGIKPIYSHHEQGPGQNEIDFQYGDILKAADNLTTFKSVVKIIAARSGLYASFMPKPMNNISGSGLHINMSLFKNGIKIFKNEPDIHSKEMESFIAGILNRIQEMTLFLNPLTNSYARLGSFEAPKYVTWSHENRSQLIRIPASKGEYARMELRSPDPACNPYISFTLLLNAGLEGIEKNLVLEKPTNYNLYKTNDELVKNFKILPLNLNEAINIAENSEFIKAALPQNTINKIIEIEKNQWQNYCMADDKDAFEQETYFNFI